MPALNSGSIRGGLGKFPKAQAILEHPFEHLLYAEGDSWFDEFTPFLHSGTDLLSALRVPTYI